MIIVRCDRCGSEIKDTQKDDNFLQYGHATIYGSDILYKKSLDLCAGCVDSFKKWICEGKNNEN